MTTETTAATAMTTVRVVLATLPRMVVVRVAVVAEFHPAILNMQAERAGDQVSETEELLVR